MSGGVDPRLSMIALHAPKLVGLGAAGDRKALTSFFITVAQDILKSGGSSGSGGGGGGGGGGGSGGSGGGGGGGGSVVKADVVFHPSPHHRHGETHLAIPHSETGALVATLIVSLESSTIAPSMYGGGDGRDTVLDLTVADRGVLQAGG